MSTSSKFGNSSPIVVIFGFLMVAVAGYLMFTAVDPNFQIQTLMNGQPVSKNTPTIINSSGYTGKIIAGTTTVYREFNQDDFERAKKEGKDILLVYYANWCPICKGEASNIEPAFEELNNPNLVGFRVNFNDTQTDADEDALAKEQEVTSQHTKVILKREEIVLKDNTPWNKEDFFDNIHNTLK